MFYSKLFCVPDGNNHASQLTDTLFGFKERTAMMRIKSTKNKVFLLILASLYLSLIPPSNSWASVRSLIGYRHIQLDEDSNHDTHPGDSFLPNASQSGSAGTTTLKNTSWIFLGARYLKENENTAFNIDLGALVGDNEEKTQNANDSRPSSAASFIYAKSEVGIQGAVGYSWKKGRFTLGGETQLSVIFIESGWDRFANQEEEKTKTRFVPTIGPKLGFYLWEDTLVEVTVQAGEAITAGANFQFKLW